ncbi:hypothetical protein AYI74_04235 [Shewanella algae]|uniref:hypothetical protein n=1 Tax=Shewanella algae TaxID=38313 RepID=UPI000D1AF51F|nr:hypothetical protein [Shewanella algae]PSS73188.1 hypothetical protein AYI88_08170 [Shewanella algae]TWU69638.1 hypothetical protein AYI74_04235 [Shewanella algae]
MYHNEHQIMKAVYDYFYNQIDGNGVIPIDLRAPALVGTVQDDPFDCWIEQKISQAFPDLEVVSSGKLTTPDIVIRDKHTGVIVGIEVKKLIQKSNGADSRGLTMDYNSCLPCGTALIKVGNATTDIPCYYLYALLSNDSSSIVTFILMHGDFINYDFKLHKEAKVANQTEYNHGPYGEGSVRHRAMYTYPNPLNYKLKCFHTRKVFVAKKLDSENLRLDELVTEEVSRCDIYGNNFLYHIVDNGRREKSTAPELIEDIFSDCKARTARQRTSASMPILSK